ncbi:hypothetical protein RFI_23847, partial [Reticulomyxa filosa]
MATESNFKDWLIQKGFKDYAELIIQNGGITDLEGLKTDFDEICAMLSLTEPEKDSFKIVVFATNTNVLSVMQVHVCCYPQQFCEEHSIAEFKDALIAAGYTDPKIFLNKTEKGLDKIGKAVGMTVGPLRKFKAAVLAQQRKKEFDVNSLCIHRLIYFFYQTAIAQMNIRVSNWCHNNGFGKFSQALMEFGIKSSRDLVSKSESDLDDLCKKCAIRMGFARAFRSAVQNLQRQGEKIAEEAMNANNEAIQISQEELKRRNGVKCTEWVENIAIWLSKMQDIQQKYCRLNLEDILHHLQIDSMNEYLNDLSFNLGDMKNQRYVQIIAKQRAISIAFSFFLPEEFEIECIFLDLCGFKVREVDEKKNEEQRKTFEICGSLDIEMVSLVQKKLYLIEQILTTISESRVQADVDHISGIFGNTFEHMSQTLGVDLRRFENEQNRGQIYKHASGFYDDQFIVFTLQQLIFEVQDSVVTSKPVLNSNHLETFVNFIGGKSTISTESASKINMNDLRYLKIHPVGLFGTKEEVIWQLQTLNCISKPMEDMLKSEKNKEYLCTGVYAIINLKDSLLKLNKTPKELASMSRSSSVNIYYIKRSNSASLFFRVLLEVCPTVCMKISQKELDHFYVNKQKECQEEQSMGGGIQATIKEEQKNDVSYDTKKMQSFLIEKEKNQDGLDTIATSKSAFVIEGAHSTILCHCSVLEKEAELRAVSFTYSSDEELTNFIKKITQTHRLTLWNKTFSSWEKASIFAKAVCPELIEVQIFFVTYFVFFLLIFLLLIDQEFDQQLHSINESYERQISAVHSTAQSLYDSQISNLEIDYGKFFAYQCKGTSLAKMKAVARELSKERVNRFFHNSSTPTWKEDFEIGYEALTKWIPDTASYHSFWRSYHKDLSKDINDLYKKYESSISYVTNRLKKQLDVNKGDNISQKRKEEQREEEKENQTLNEKKSFRQQSDNNKPTSKDSQVSFGWLFSRKIFPWPKAEMQLTEGGNKIAENYTFIQIQYIAFFGRIYEYFKYQFPGFEAIKTVSDQEKELNKTYNNNRLKQESELNKTFLKKLEDKLKNDCPLVCVIEKWQNNKINLNMDTRLKPIRRLTFTFGNFTKPNPNYLELKQVAQKNNEFDIHSNEELVFVYGLSNNEIVLVLSIDRNMSDCLPEDEEINKEGEKYGVGNEHAKKQDVWNEQYNQNCATKIFLSSRQVLNRTKKPIGELRGRITLIALSEQRHYMVLYERARQLIHVYSWKERIVDSLQPLKNKTIDLRERVLPDGFYVTSMCFDNKDDSLYILDNTSTIHCIELDSGLFNHEREIVCKEQYVKLMTTFEGGYIVGIKSHENKEEEEVQTSHNKDKINKEDAQTPGEHDEPGSATTDTKEEETQAVTFESATSINTSNTAIITSTKCEPNSLVQCDFYILDDSKELVRSLVLPKEFTSGGIHGIQFKLILQTQVYIVSLDDARCALLCLPSQVSLKKSQLHLKLTSMYRDVTIPSDDEKVGTRIPSKLDYIEYSLDKFGSKPEFFIQKNLTLHLSVLFDANEITSSSSPSWVSKESVLQISELVLHTCNKIKQDTKKVFRHLDWQCVPLVIDGKNKQIHLKD